jgi:hypothetical protein
MHWLDFLSEQIIIDEEGAPIESFVSGSNGWINFLIRIFNWK